MIGYRRHVNPDGTEGGWVVDTATVHPTATIEAGAAVGANARVGVRAMSPTGKAEGPTHAQLRALLAEVVPAEVLATWVNADLGCGCGCITLCRPLGSGNDFAAEAHRAQRLLGLPALCAEHAAWTGHHDDDAIRSCPDCIELLKRCPDLAAGFDARGER